MRFVKMHGLGNDFILFDALAQSPESVGLTEDRLPEVARRLCDRHFGVGGDGLIFALPSRTADFRMRLLNSDGSEARHCGNGIRCLAKLVYEEGHTRATRITVETPGRINVLDLDIADSAVRSVRVDMGSPGFRRAEIPVGGDPDGDFIDQPLQVNGRVLRFTALSMGNPHAVTFLDEDPEEFPVTLLGPEVERNSLFPDRTNVEFIRLAAPGRLQMRVWERGAGETLACGTGACAALVAAAVTGRAGRSATVRLPGGDLFIEWTPQDRVLMTGPAETVFEGDVDPDEIELP